MKQLDVIEEALLSMPRHKGDIVDKALASLQELRESLGWRPIESAPRDGNFVLCAHESGHINKLQWCCDEYWRSRLTDKPNFWKPTYWMPLPEPPQD